MNERNFANPNGGFTFDGTVTGADFADFLLGATSTHQRSLHPGCRAVPGFAHPLWWRVRAGLLEGKIQSHANLGLRWEVSMPWYDTQGKIQTFNPGQTSTLFPLAPTGLVFPGDPGIPKTLAPTRLQQLRPTIGIGVFTRILGRGFGQNLWRPG